jgi:predicted nucleic acid-binding protein
VRKSTTAQVDKDRVRQALANGQLRSSPIVKMELYNGARSAEEIEQLNDVLRVQELPLVAAIADWAADAVAALVEPHSSVKLGDALIAATAKAHRIAVLTCDWTDFPRLARVLAFDLYHPFDESSVLLLDPRHSRSRQDD